MQQHNYRLVHKKDGSYVLEKGIMIGTVSGDGPTEWRIEWTELPTLEEKDEPAQTHS